ncbi:S-adenosyl-L-methionine-dependent methyltransferase [Cadophora sp. DSE1049]|nr:S-adenosyl-L-methionine-dependent methyltransferase [Cadophora sp. DSE1049]
MAGRQDVVVIEDDNFITIDDDDYLPPTTFVGSRAEPLITQAADPIQPNRSTSRINSTFRQPNWGFKTSKSMSTSQTNTTTSNPNRSESLKDPRSFAGCPSPSYGPRSFGGSAQQPIQLDDEDTVMGMGVARSQRGSIRRPIQFKDEDIEMDMGPSRRASRTQPASNRHGTKNSISSLSISHRRRSSNKEFITLDDENITGPFSREERSPTLQRSLEQTRKSTKQGELIDLESLEDAAGEGLEMLRIEDVYEKEVEAQKRRRKKSTIRYERRNPSIVSPWQRMETFCVNDVTLKSNKTVQLKDESFLRIKDILCNYQTKEIRLRGHRLQRARDLNGLLEKKLNELVLFLEVDQDDPRIPTEQSTVEVSLNDFEKLRSVRFTNQKFPLGRNCDPKEFRNKEHAALEGGLTVRWKYTCTYENAADRHHNIHKERSLERLRADECTLGFEIPDEDGRTHWRGETVPGGAWRPSLKSEDVVMIPDSPGRKSTSLAGTSDKDVLILDDEETNVRVGGTGPRRKEKRTFSSISVRSSEATVTPGPLPKRVRQENDGVEETREGVSRIDLHSTTGWSPMSIDCPFQPGRQAASPPTIDLSSDLSPTIDLISSEPSHPISYKERRSSNRQSQTPIARLAGQTYTYGDAFCGGGGSSRGATMAGLRLKWGFDFNKHACLSWRANFPSSQCHQMAAHEFVDQAQRAADNGHPDMMKVDILHLSPPCQFFSPAHTIDGPDDEMNVASLFAVQMVIDVSRPRIVTLEQTFGIACPRFRFYFNALIQMFTTHDFSVRWAIVPLAQWGLPQRRMRLIVIASCPGEHLPKMPLPTHSAPDSDSSLNLPRFVSADTTLKSIPAGAADHDIESVMWAPDRQMPPWDGSKILPRAMTTSGGQNHHPSGTRDLTLREYACLQGFPTGHVFRGNYVKKQIGNAVPPVVAKVLFGSIKADLEKIDGVEGPELIE